MRMTTYGNMTKNICAPLIAGTEPDRLVILQVQALELWRSFGFSDAEERAFVIMLDSPQPFINMPSKYRKFMIGAVGLFKELRDERSTQQAS